MKLKGREEGGRGGEGRAKRPPRLGLGLGLGLRNPRGDRCPRTREGEGQVPSTNEMARASLLSFASPRCLHDPSRWQISEASSPWVFPTSQHPMPSFWVLPRAA